MKYALMAMPALLLMAALPFSRTAIHGQAGLQGKEKKLNSPDAGEKKEGWTMLFDGKTTNGWHSYGKATAAAEWEAKDGALHLNKSKSPGEGGDLVTDGIYGNFDLKLEWKISPKGNSGIIFYVNEDTTKYKEPYFTGLEDQVLDNDGHPDGKIHKHRAGDLYDLIACSRETVKPVGEWNEAEIYCKDGELKLYLNGVKTVSTTLWNDDWRTLVAGSKFKKWPDFGTFKSGKIDLQDHGNEVWFRNIRIKNL
jgi:3-keto-disaccharide hydrolase